MVLGDQIFILDDKTKFYKVRLTFKNKKFEVIKSDGWWKSENNTLNKFYDKNNVSMGVSLSCADKEKNCGLSKGEDIYNSKGYWKLSAKEWLAKFYPYLKVDSYRL